MSRNNNSNKGGGAAILFGILMLPIVGAETVIEKIFLYSEMPMGYEDFKIVFETYFYVTWAGLSAALYFALLPEFCLIFWTEEDFEWVDNVYLEKLILGGGAFVLMCLSLLLFCFWDFGGDAIVRMGLLVFNVACCLIIVLAFVYPSPIYELLEPEYYDDDDEYYDDDEYEYDDDEDDDEWEDDADFSEEELTVAETIREVFPDDSFSEELMLKAQRKLEELHLICDEIEALNAVADDNLRKVLAILEDMFFIILEEPARLNDTARNTLTIFLEKVTRIAKNLKLLLEINGQDTEKYQRVQEVFVQFEEILNIRRDTLYSHEMSQLETDLSMLEDEMESMTRKRKMDAILDGA